MSGMTYSRPGENYLVYIDDVARSVSGSAFLVCVFSLLCWRWTGLVIINPFVSVVAGGASILFFAMGLMIQRQRTRSPLF